MGFKISTNRIYADQYTESIIRDMVNSYLDAVRFTDMDSDSEFEGDEEFSDEAIYKAKENILDFLIEYGYEKAFKDYTYSYEGYSQAECMAHDIWYSQNHHSVGFWDRGLGEVGQRMTECAQNLGKIHACLGKNGKVYLE